MDFSNLQSRVSTAYIPPHRTQLLPRMHSLSQFSSPNPSKSSPSQSRDKFCLIAASFLFIPFLIYLFAIGRGIHQSSKFDESRPKGFGIIINVGRVGSRIHVFEFLNEGRIPFVAFDGKEGSISMMVPPGLQEFESNPDSVGSSILSLLEFAKDKVPKMEWKDTKVWLMARNEMLELEAMKEVLESCRRVLRSSGFQFKDDWASAITGQEEGLYAWVAANYALGTLGGDPQETTGIVELGGASVQVTFALREPPLEDFSRVVKLAGITYNLYARSILSIGQDVAWELLHEKNPRLLTLSLKSSDGFKMDPCIPKGYVATWNPTIAMDASDKQLLTSNSVGNFAACRSKVLAYIHKTNADECLHPPCKNLSTFIPELRGKPVLPENFFYISEFFGLVPKASLSELVAAGHHYCEDDWSKMKDEHQGIHKMDLLRYCFTSAYVVALLNESFGISMDDKRIGFANQAEGVPLDWTLGAFILQTVMEPLESETENLGGIVGNNSVSYLSLSVVVLFILFGAISLSRLWKPQLKTVYDLEKGHYIITRVPR